MAYGKEKEINDKSYNPVLECIQKRRSIRKFKSKPIEWGKIGEILDAARYAPCAGNLQNWRFIVVTDKDKISKLAAAANQNWVAFAPVVIVINTEHVHGQRYYGVRGERLYNVQNCAAAAENMVIAATALDLGSCWVGSFSEDLVNSIVGNPDYMRPQAMICIGYPDEEPDVPVKYRIEITTFFENWNARITSSMFYIDKPQYLTGAVKYSKSILDWIKNKLGGEKNPKTEKTRYQEQVEHISDRIKEDVPEENNNDTLPPDSPPEKEEMVNDNTIERDMNK